MVEGTSTIRTRVASIRMAIGEAEAEQLEDAKWSPSTNDPKTHTMMAAAAVMTRAVDGKPVGDRGAVVAGAQPLLPDPRQQEHLVVHRQPEQDGEHHERDPGV